MRLLALCALAVAAVTVAFVPSASASPYVRVGVQDDAWLVYGPGSLDARLDTLDRLGVDIVRYTLDWRQIEPRKGAWDWSRADETLRGLHARGITVVATLWGTPRWANGGRGANVPPTSAAPFAAFARAAALRYPFVRHWLVWNEPNKRPFLNPASPSLYVQRLLNPAYAAIHGASRRALVGGGVTGPIAGRGGMSPVRFLEGMKRAGARLDAVAHNPYPAYPKRETPFAGGCTRCATITMATLEKLLTLVHRQWGGKRIWLTEYGYQTNPPDRALGVARARQAAYVSQASLRAYLAPRVDMLIWYGVRDDTEAGGWQSGLFGTGGAAKPSYGAFRFPLAARGRTLWGQIRPRSGKQPYRLQRKAGPRWVWSGPKRWTGARGVFAVRVANGTYRMWSVRDRAFGPTVRVT